MLKTTRVLMLAALLNLQPTFAAATNIESTTSKEKYIEKQEKTIIQTDNTTTTEKNQEAQCIHLEEIIKKHKIVITKEFFKTDNETENITATVILKRAEDEKIFSKYDIKGSIDATSITFRYLPENFFIQIETINAMNTTSTRIEYKSPILKNKVLKTIITDRDRTININGKIKPERKTYLIEGDLFNPFAYIKSSSLVSLGNPNNPEPPGGNYTPLGFYYVKSKDLYWKNKTWGWITPNAVWYTKKTGTPEGLNGLHYYDAPYGEDNSHGCTELPKEFSKLAFDWSEISMPIIIIGNEYKHEDDKNRFNKKSYRLMQTIIEHLEEDKEKLYNKDYTSTLLTPNEINALNKLNQSLNIFRKQGFRNDAPSGYPITLKKYTEQTAR